MFLWCAIIDPHPTIHHSNMCVCSRSQIEFNTSTPLKSMTCKLRYACMYQNASNSTCNLGLPRELSHSIGYCDSRRLLNQMSKLVLRCKIHRRLKWKFSFLCDLPLKYSTSLDLTNSRDFGGFRCLEWSNLCINYLKFIQDSCYSKHVNFIPISQ